MAPLHDVYKWCILNFKGTNSFKIKAHKNMYNKIIQKRIIIKDEEGYLIIIKREIHQEYILIINIHLMMKFQFVSRIWNITSMQNVNQ